MSEFYEFEGTTYEVSPGRLEEFMERFPDATKSRDSFEIRSIDTKTGQPIPEGDLLIGDGILTEDQINEQKRHAEAEQASREVLKDFYSKTTGIPKFMLPYVTNFTGGTAGLASGLFKSVEATAENIIGMSAQEQREDGVNPISVALDSFHDFTDAFDTKYYDEQGRSLQVDELLEKKEYKKAIQIGSEQAAESAPSMIASAYNPLLGGALMGVSTAGTTYFDDLENRPDAVASDIIKNSLIAGSSEFLTEWAGGYFFRRVSKIGQTLKGTGNAEKVAKDFTKGFLTKFVTRALGGGIGEAATETLNSMTQDLGEDWVYDEAFDKKKFISNAINSAVPALLLGGFGGGMSTLNKQDRKDLYKFVADGKWKRDYMDIGAQIYEKSNDYKAADDKQKVRIKEELDALQAKKQKHEQDLFDSFENLTDKELTDIARNIDKINENADIVGNKDFSETTQKQREQETIDLLQKNYNILGREYTGEDIEVDKIISESLKASERLDPMLKKLKGINREDLETQVINTDKELQALPENIRKQVEKGDGYFLAKDKDGKAKIYINARIAGLSGATNVVGHELLHYMISRKFKTNNKSMKPFIDNLKSYLQENHADVYSRLQTRIDNFYTNPDGTIKDGALEEYLTIFSDLVATQKIDLKENESKGFRDNVKDIVLGFGVGEVKLDTAQDFIKFIRAYNKNINRKGLLGKLMGTKILDVKLKSKTLKEGKPETIGKKSMSAAEIKQVEERVTEIGLTYNFEGGKDLWDEKGADQAIDEMKRDGTIDNLIASKYKVRPVPEGFINDVFNKLIPDIRGFNPEINNDFGGYLGPRINFRAGDIYKEIYEKKSPATVPTEARTKEGEVKVQIAAETDAAMEAFETEDLSPAAQAVKKSEEQKKSALDKKLGLTSADIEKFINTLEKAFGTKLPPVTSKEYRLALEKVIATDLKNTIQKIFGKGIDYDIFVENDLPLLLKDFTVESLIQMEREVGGKRFPNGRKIFATKKRITKVAEVRKLQAEGLIAKDVKPESGPNLLTRLPMPNKKEINAFFRGKDMLEVLGYQLSKSAFGTRKDRTAENIAIQVAFNKAMEVVQDPKVLTRRLAIEELQGREQIENYVAEVGRTIDRDPNVKQSKSMDIALEEYNIGKADLSILLKENSLGQIEANYPLLYDAIVLDFEQAYGPQEFVNKRYLDLLKEASPELAKLVKDKVHITRKKVKGEYVFEVEMLEDHFKNYSLGLLDFIPSFMGVRENNVKGNYKFLENAGFKGSSSRGNGGDTLEKRKNNRKKFRNKLDKMGKNLTPETKKLWREFQKVMDNLELAESTFDMPETLLRDLRRIQRSNKTTKQKIKEAQKLFNPGALTAAQKLFTAYNASVQDWVNHQVKNNEMTREQAIAYVIRDKQKNTNFTKGERALAAFTSVYLEDGVQKLEKKDSKGEHVTDSATVSGKTTISIYNNTLVQDAPSILNGFEQSYVPKKFADEMDKLGGANSPLKNFRFILNPQIGKKVYDLATGKTMYELGLEQYKLNQAKLMGEIYTKHETNKVLNNIGKMSRSTNIPSKGITVLDFDDTLATTKSLVKYTTPDGKTGTLNAEEYANTYEDLLNKGYTFDFSDFNKVVKGKLAPLFNKAIKLQGKFGPENMFVLTARPPAAQKAIFDFLKANGLNIPLKNITGLGNSTAEAKALWIADKVGEGYNDFYFADDALQNVQAVKNMLDQLDVKSKVQQARVKFSQSMDGEFNKILEEVTGIETKKRFSDIKARKRGKSKGKFRFFIPPSHEDFVGLLYNFMGKGKKGDQHRDFFEKALVRPLNRAYREIDTAKQAIANDYKSLNKQFDGIKKKLRKKTPDGDFTFEDAVRIYLWNKHGYDIPGLTLTDQQNLVDLVNSDTQLQNYAEALNIISKQDTYVDPGNGWEAGNIKTDLMDATGRVGRAEFFAEFNENADVLFSKENLNKIEAAYGKDFRSALEDMLHRIKTGVNRPKGQSGTINSLMNYLNGSVGTVMFFNVRSAILQQMSIVNYINFADNNLFAAAKAFANQKQYWKDFAFIFNSDMLKQRRGGIGTDINGADLAQAVEGSKQPTKIVISKLLKLGFLPTQIGDNIAIATGGATFYRNRINKYIKDGLSQKEAEAKAFTDFQDLTQSTQQSSRPDMTSKQQASWIGKLVLNFQNITSQYNRIIKKAALDIKNRRISPPYTTQAKSDLGNLSKILYYGGIQNVIFYSLQTALFAVMFDDDQDEDQILKKSERVIQGSIDSILRGAGIYGAVASTLKNMIIKFNEQRDKGYNKDESAVPMELLNFSPVVGIKIRQLVNAEKTLNYNENIISEMETFEAENPMWSAVTNYTQALTNFPANRLYQKSINMRNALDKDYTNFQRVMFFSGYTTWSLGLGDSEAIIEAKEKVKINKANTKKSKKKSIEKAFKEKGL